MYNTNELKNYLAMAHFGKHGELRWNSNDSCPMKDMLDEMLQAGLISEQTANITLECRAKDTEEFIRAYAAEMAAQEASTEEEYEMRAAFGAGATVVNVLTGKRYYL